MKYTDREATSGGRLLLMRRVRFPRIINVPSVDEGTISYLESRYGLKVTIAIPKWWGESERKCWEILETMYKYQRRYQEWWWGQPPSKASLLLHEVAQWRCNVIRWISMEKENRKTQRGLIVHTFSLPDLLGTAFKVPPDVSLVCNGKHVNYVEDREEYLKLYNELLRCLSTMLAE